MREFNTTGLCVPSKHYMVDISERVEQIRAMVDKGDYFCINRARQYGKTTTIAALEDALAGDYVVASLDLQALSEKDFRSEGAFARAVAAALIDDWELALLDMPDVAAGAIRSVAGVDGAVRLLLNERNTLFESLAGKLEAHPDFKRLLRSVLMEGERIPYSGDHDGLAQLMMCGFVRRGADNSAQVANRIFETRLYDLFILEDRIEGSRVYSAGELGRSACVREGRLDMRAVLEGFRRAYVQVFGPPEEGERFSEFDGRRQFLLYLKPIINGTGNYYIEAQTRDQTRTDVVVDYAGEQFVLELKIWRGPRYNEEAEEQHRGYLDRFGLDVGYMLSFNFNKHKEPGLRRVAVGDKVIWEETV